MVWRKKGRLFGPPEGLDWARSHAMLPVVQSRDNSELRVLFSSRDAENRSFVGRAVLSLDEPGRVRFDPRPLLSPGSLGAFDDSGVNASSMVELEDRVHLYFIGWVRGVTVPFYTCIGCAVSEDGGNSFERVSQAPILGRSSEDPYFVTSPWVRVEDGRWRLWYASATEWEQGPDGPRHRYCVKYAESTDGLDWRRDGHVCIDYRDEGEYAIARPCVMRDGELYRMWYSFRGPSYRIGYAESRDGYDWVRRDELAGIDVSPTGWDAEMIEYPFVFDYQGARHMLYNGDGYGRSGVGHAVLEDGNPSLTRP